MNPLLAISILLLFVILYFFAKYTDQKKIIDIDKQTDYSMYKITDFNIEIVTALNGETYGCVELNKLEEEKKKELLRRFKPGGVIWDELENYFVVKNRNFYENVNQQNKNVLQFRIFLEPVDLNQKPLININGNGNLINLTFNSFYSMYIYNIRNEFQNLNNMEDVDKDFILNCLDGIEKGEVYTSNEYAYLLSLLRKYEPLMGGLSLLIDTINLLLSMIK